MTTPLPSQITQRVPADSQELRIKVGKWLLFEIVFALLPLFFNWGTAILHDKSVSWGLLVGRGELLLISVAIIAAAIGNLVNSGWNEKLHGVKQTLVGVGFILGCTGTWLYSQAAIFPGENNDINTTYVVGISVIVTIGAIVLSLACLITAEVK
ncbi:MAG: hypothetical protein ACRDQ4_05150 [Pseudonocardiaceae bacterium]